MTVRILSWRAGKNFTTHWHLQRSGQSVLLCHTVIPSGASLCFLGDHSAGLQLEQLCRRCLRVFSESED